jgi:hypothetical protein
MSQTTTLILLPQTTWQGNIYANLQYYDVIGDKQPAAAYYLGNKDLQTVNINLAGVTGNIFIQATLATTPVDIDWFNVYELEANAAAPANSAANIAAYANEGVNINGNFVWMRAKVQDFHSGVVQYIKLSY